MAGISAKGLSMAVLDTMRNQDELRLQRLILALSRAVDKRDAAELEVLKCLRSVAEVRHNIDEATRNLRWLVDREAA